MGFLDSIFGNKKLSLQDELLGAFTGQKVRGRIFWEGEVEFLQTTVTLHLSGTQNSLDSTERSWLLDALKRQPAFEVKVNDALKEQYDNADIGYSKWQDHFNLLSVGMSGDEMEISFEEKESLYLFNVHFLKNEVNGVSIDS